MPTRNIACLNCGHEGMLDVHYVNDVVPKGLLFKHFGHNPYSGDLHYQCPACKIILLIDPARALGVKSLKGFPRERGDLPASRRSVAISGREPCRWFNQMESRA